MRQRTTLTTTPPLAIELVRRATELSGVEVVSLHTEGPAPHVAPDLAGHAPTTTAYRVTHVFRREADGWKVVLRHADHLVEFLGPEAVLPPDG